VRAVVVWSDWAVDGRKRQRAEHKRRSLSSHNERNDWPYLLEGVVGSEALIDRYASANGDALAQRHLDGRSGSNAEERFAIAERVVKFGVVAVEQRVGS
jgi:hypothetical protein